MKLTTSTLWVLLITISLSSLTLAFDDANDMTVDRAESNNFEDFHEKDDSYTTWDGKEVETWENPSDKSFKTSKQKQVDGVVTEELEVTETYGAAATSNISGPQFQTGSLIKVREAYKMSMDPRLEKIPTLFEAVHSLHSQLNYYCPRGWEKREEWVIPNSGFHLLHWAAKCN